MSPLRHLKKELQIQKVLKTVSLTTPKKLHLNMVPSYVFRVEGGCFQKQLRQSPCLSSTSSKKGPWGRGGGGAEEITHLNSSLREWSKPESWVNVREHKEGQTWWTTKSSAFLASELRRAEPNDSCKQMDHLGMLHCPVFILQAPPPRAWKADGTRLATGIQSYILLETVRSGAHLAQWMDAGISLLGKT